MDISTEAKKVGFMHLAKRINNDGETITYRIISRELGITVQESKQLLSDYSQDSAAISRGLSVVYALSGTLSPLAAPEPDAMEIDEVLTGTTTSSADSGLKRTANQMQSKEIDVVESFNIRSIILVKQAELENKLKLFSSPPTSHIYSISPAPLDLITLLTSYDLPLESPLPEIGFEWKAVVTNFNYGGCQILDSVDRAERLGFGKDKGKGKQRAVIKVVPKVKETKVTTKSNLASTSASTSSSSKLKMDPSPQAKTKVKSKAAAPVEKPARVSLFDRPMGQMGGLFAKKVEPKKVEPIKKKKIVVSEPEESEEDVKPKMRLKPKPKSSDRMVVDDDEESALKKAEDETDSKEALLKEKEKKKLALEEKRKAVKARNAKNAIEIERVRQAQELAEMMAEGDVKPKKGIDGFFK